MQAQEKYGHLNFGNLITIMPAAESADKELQVFQEQLIKEGEAKAKAFQDEVQAYTKKVQEGVLTPQQQQTQETELQRKQQEIVALEQSITQDVGQKRNELLAPIIEEAQRAIEEVAKENNFLLIFDTSIFGAVLFAQESVDVLPLVKAKLNL